MDRFSTSFPLSSELPLHGGLSQHDLSVRISRSRGVLRCAYSTYAFRDVGPSVFSFDRLKDPSFCFMPLPFPESQALNTHSVEFSSRLPSSPSIKSDSAKRSYPPSSALSCRITSDTDLRLAVPETRTAPAPRVERRRSDTADRIGAKPVSLHHAADDVLGRTEAA